MSLIEENTLNQILSHYSKEHHSLLLLQLDNMEKLISENINEYSNDKNFQKAFDIILTNIIEGKFIEGDIDDKSL